MAFLNVMAAEEALPRIVEIMAKELGWSKAKQQVRVFFHVLGWIAYKYQVINHKGILKVNPWLLLPRLYGKPGCDPWLHGSHRLNGV